MVKFTNATLLWCVSYITTGVLRNFFGCSLGSTCSQHSSQNHSLTQGRLTVGVLGCRMDSSTTRPCQHQLHAVGVCRQPKQLLTHPCTWAQLAISINQHISPIFMSTFNTLYVLYCVAMLTAAPSLVANEAGICPYKTTTIMCYTSSTFSS